MKKSNKKGQKPHKPETTGNTRRAERQPKQRVQSSTFLTLPKRLWEIFAGIAVIVGFIAIFYPRISVSPASSLDPQSTSLPPFIISNEGNITLNKVEGMTAIKSIELASGMKLVGPDSFTGGVILDKNRAPVMKPGEKLTVFSPFEFGNNPVSFADIAISVSYELPIVHVKMEKVFRFTTEKGNWFPQPVSK